MESKEDEIINELLAMGILKDKGGQLMVSDNFLLVLDGEGFMFRDNLRKQIIHTIYRFAPAVEKERVLTYVATIEGYFLQN